MSDSNRWGVAFNSMQRAAPDPYWSGGYTLPEAEVAPDAGSMEHCLFFRLHEPPIERLKKWNPVPEHVDVAWEFNIAHRAARFSTGLSHYVALCDRFDLRNGIEPRGPYAHLKPFPSGWQTHASGGRMLFDARQATSAARREISFAAQRLLLPLLGHPLIETAFRANPLAWSVVARFLAREAAQAAKRINRADLADEQLDDERTDDWYKKHWRYKMEASRFLQDPVPEAPDDPSEFFRFMSEAMNETSRPRRPARNLFPSIQPE